MVLWQYLRYLIHLKPSSLDYRIQEILQRIQMLKCMLYRILNGVYIILYFLSTMYNIILINSLRR